MTVVLQLVLSGILVGSVYGLIGMGFVMVYRSGRVFNMAYGQFAVLGAFVASMFLGTPASPNLPLPIAAPLTLLAAVAIGLAVEYLFFRRLIGRPLFSSFILTLGLLAMLNSIIMIVWGPVTRPMAPLFPSGPFNLGEVVLAREYLWTFGVALAALAGFAFFFRRTRLGLAIRAAYDDQAAARCLGISVKLNAQIAWAISAIMATLGGVLVGSVQGVSILLSDLVMVVLAVVLLGGLDSLGGAVVAGLALAIGQNLATYYLGAYIPDISGAFSVVLIMLVLLVRPTGLFGERPVERV